LKYLNEMRRPLTSSQIRSLFSINPLPLRNVPSYWGDYGGFPRQTTIVFIFVAVLTDLPLLPQLAVGTPATSVKQQSV
jgi:hypothetical protein